MALYELEPSANAAYKIAKLYLKKEKLDDAAVFYKKAYTQETDNEKKAKYYYEAALIASALKQVSNSYRLAIESKKLNENNGNVYILIAQLYVQGIGNCGENNYKKSLVYCAAVDKLNMAKAKDPSVATKANKLIGTYSSRYPDKEMAFMHGKVPGDTETVGCWIQVSTTLRCR